MCIRYRGVVLTANAKTPENRPAIRLELSFNGDWRDGWKWETELSDLWDFIRVNFLMAQLPCSEDMRLFFNQIRKENVYSPLHTEYPNLHLCEFLHLCTCADVTVEWEGRSHFPAWLRWVDFGWLHPAAPSLALLSRTGEKKRWKNSWVTIKTGRSLIIGKTDLTWGKLI